MSKNKKALVTLTIGDKYVSQFKKYCQKLWETYCNIHGYDLIVFNQPLDSSERAKGRSPAWQKLLVLKQPEVINYEQVVWVDSDILINCNSPDICDSVSLKNIGAVDAYSLVSKNLYEQALSRLYSDWERAGVNFIRNLKPHEYHHLYGLPEHLDRVVQTGVLVISPQHHADIFQMVYDKYEERGSAEWNYEMRPLSYELQLNCEITWLDSRFNMIWPDYKNMFYEFLNKQTTLERVCNRLHLKCVSRRQRDCANAAFSNNFFLHFAGTASEMHWPELPNQTPEK
jgi:hypothetical protein